jgi:hypothetical protein
LILIAAFGTALRRAAAAPRTQARKVRSSPTAVGNTVIGAAAAKETLDSIAGRPSRDTQAAVALITFALAVHAVRPTVRRASHTIRTAWRDTVADLRKLSDEIGRFGI